jgi:toxin CcdB
VAQWNVYVNPAAKARDEIPYFVVVQSDLLDDLATRMVVPLSRSTARVAGETRRLAPEFEIAGERLRLKPHEAGAMPVRALGKPVADLKSESHRIVDALDTVISGV